MAESQKAKQLQSFLEAEKKVLASRVQHAIASADPLKQHVNRLEDQVKYLMVYVMIIFTAEFPFGKVGFTKFTCVT